MSRNKVSPLIRGFDYQVLCALEFCIEWLEDENKFRSIQFETIPEDSSEKDFVLDDIIIRNSNEQILSFQIKHTESPDDYWSLENLLETPPNTRNGKRRYSLLERWKRSFFSSSTISGGAFITNRQCSNTLRTLLTGSNFDYLKVKESNSEAAIRLRALFNDSSEMEMFLNNFSFRFNHSAIADLESKLLVRASSVLGLTREGWLNLKNSLKNELARGPETHTISVENLRDWGLWCKPRSLNQDFKIPDDFVLFDKEKHRKFKKHLRSPSESFAILSGGPGTGKSTYLSYIQILLNRAKFIVLRHHYYLSEDDVERGERMRADRVLEALRSQILQYRSALGSLSSKNPDSVNIAEYLKKLGSEELKKGRKVILIIDGLDHALRENLSEELKSLLREILPFQKGVHVILGAQPQVINFLPSTLAASTNSNKPFEVPPLTIRGIEVFLSKQTDKIKLPVNDLAINAILNALFELTEGNPLHLRYSVSQLISQNRMLSEQDIRQLIPFGGGIQKYYAKLWVQLEENAKRISILSHLSPFPLWETEFLEILQTDSNCLEYDYSLFRKISHLLKNSLRGLTVFHNSFGLYLETLPEWKFEERRLISLLHKWLENLVRNDLKDMFLPCIQADLGQYIGFEKLNRSWATEKLTKCWSNKEIDKQLKKALSISKERGLLEQNSFISQLAIHFSNTCQFNEDLLSQLYTVAIKLEIPDYRRYDLPHMPAAFLAEVAICAAKQRRTDLISDIFKILKNRRSQLPIKSDYGSDSIPDQYYTALVYSLLPKVSNESLNRLVKHFHEYRWDDEISRCFIRTSRLLGKTLELNMIAPSFMEKSGNENLLYELLLPEFEQGSTRLVPQFKLLAKSEVHPLIWLYMRVGGGFLFDLPPLPKHSDLKEPKHDYEIRDYSDWTNTFFKCAVLGLIYGIEKKERIIQNWCDSIDNTWLQKTIAIFFTAGLKASNFIEASERISVVEITETFASIRALTYLYDSEILGFQLRVQHAYARVLCLLQSINSSNNFKDRITATELSLILNTPILGEDSAFTFAANNNLAQIPLNEEAFQILLQVGEKQINTSIQRFPDRTAKYLELAHICIRHENLIHAKQLLRLASDNFLAYGEHKDLYFSDVLLALDATVGTPIFPDWSDLQDFITKVENVSEYTDGDETNHFPHSMAELIAKASPEKLRGFYLSSINKGNLELSEGILCLLFKSWLFNSPEQIAVAMTALEDKAYNCLKELQLPFEGAKQALHSINRVFGERREIEPYKHSDSSQKYLKEDITNFEHVNPKDVSSHIEKFDNKYSQNHYLKNWAKYWLVIRGLKDVEWESAYWQLLALLKREGLHNADGELLDIIYPSALLLEPTECFDYLCLANDKNFGWSLYWHSDAKRLSRWQFLKDHFKDRYLEFLEYRTKLGTSGNNWYNETLVSFPLGVRFLVFFEDFDRAKIPLLAALKYAKQITGNLELPESSWTVSTYSIVDVLFSRLNHPLPLIRERAVTAISWLYNQSSEFGAIIIANYHRMLSTCFLESIAIEYLLGIYRLCQDNKTLFSIVEVKKIIEACQVDCFVCREILAEISEIVGVSVSQQTPQKAGTVENVISTYNANLIKDIERSPVRNFLPLLESIEGYDQDQVIKILDGHVQLAELQSPIPKGTYSVSHWRRMDGSYANFASPPEYHIYLSAFIRLLEQTYAEGRLDELIYYKWSLKSSPIDLALWDKLPARAPEWWFKSEVISKPINESNELIAREEIDSQIVKLLTDKNDWTFLGISGAVPNNGDWQDRHPSFDIKVLGFAYKITGSNIPEASEIWPQIAKDSRIILLPNSKKPLKIADRGSVFYSFAQTVSYEFSDLEIALMVSPYETQVGGAWQWYRQRGYLAPSPFHCKNLKLSLVEPWHWHDSKDQLAIKIVDFCEGIDGYASDQWHLPIGQFTKIRTDLIQEYLSKRGFRLGYFVITESLVRTSWDQHKEFTAIRFFNMSQIIT